MNLSTQEDKILLRNCIIVKLYQLKLEKEARKAKSLGTEQIQNEIDLYKNINQLIISDDTEALIDTLNHYKNIDSISKFSAYALSSKSSKELADKYLNITKELMTEYNEYSEENFKQFQRAFLRGTNIRLNETKPKDNLEEEPINENYSITTEDKNNLKKLFSLVRQPNQKLSPEEFRNISEKFRDLTKILGMSKFQHSFNKQHQTILNMDISFDTIKYSKPVYLTKFEIKDEETEKISHINVYESASNSGFASTYYQNLCFAYLESDEFSKADDTYLTNEIITSKMNIYSDCYKNIHDMMLKCNLYIKHGKIFQSAESSYIPSNELDLSTDNIENNEKDFSI